MANTKEGKRCHRPSVEGQNFCKQHMKDSKGRSRRLTASKCIKLKRTSRSPYGNKVALRRGGRTYTQIYTVCKKRMDNLVRRLESREDLPESLAKHAADIKKEWARTRKVIAPKAN